MVKTREKDCHLISVGKDYKPKNLGFLHLNAQSRHVFPVSPNMSRPHTLAAPAYLLWLEYSQVVQHYLEYRHCGLFELRGDNQMSKFDCLPTDIDVLLSTFIPLISGLSHPKKVWSSSRNPLLSGEPISLAM